ncbi:flagellar hook-associated protein FlgL [Clostridium neonatale]|uniref:B-type flagellin n=1 Tax=Clostridium neonatale TaxID=137838 RepID=A0A650MKL2_9CLOT|nr:flagellar hook-associated protein FlgL [Clostridium neonatale]SUQ50570.1 B-type flagellin [Clostridium neonatale]SUQ51798.1 B-type flagellin [Clostridium neonatale]VCT85597.1 B-type flagellin [Clostridium neonatale]
MQRITNSMMTSKFLSNMKRNLNNMSTLQNQLASGKEILRTSQNPFAATRNKQLANQISDNEQYNANIKDTSNWLDTTDTALAQAGNVMARIKELMVKAGNGAYSEDEIATIKNEVVEKSKELAQIMNTTFDGAYIFGGTKGTSKPVTVDSNGNLAYADKNGNGFGNPAIPDVSTGNDKTNAESQLSTSLKTEISQGVVVEYNKTATDIFEFTDTKLGDNINVMNEISTLINNLGKMSDKTGATTDAEKEAALNYVNGEGLSKMDSIVQNLLANRAQVGTMQNRMESAMETNEDQNYNMTDILSSSEDIDFTEKTMEYAVMQTVYTASLQTSSKVLMNTIMDYI